MDDKAMPNDRGGLWGRGAPACADTPRQGRIGAFVARIAADRARRFAAVTCFIGICSIGTCSIGISACSSTPDGSGTLDKGLQTVGLQKPQSAQFQAPGFDGATDALPRGSLPMARKVTLRLHAGDVLNSDSHGRSLSIVARIYKLRDKVAFEAAPYADFQELKPSKSPEFAGDIVAVKEVVLTPGKQYDVIETVGFDAPYFAVVALFRAPAPQRWRFVFESKSASSTGVTLGVHACALSVSAGLALDVAPEMLRVAGVNCPQT